MDLVLVVVAGGLMAWWMTLRRVDRALEMLGVFVAKQRQDSVNLAGTIERAFQHLESFEHVAEAVAQHVEARTSTGFSMAEGVEGMPKELKDFINSWPDEWAREGLAGYARELKGLYGNWDAAAAQIFQEHGVLSGG